MAFSLKRPPRRHEQPTAPPPNTCAPDILYSKPRASFEGGLPRSGFDIAWHHRTGADVNDVNDVPSLSEPYGPDVAVADRGRGGAEISQSGAAGRFRPVISPAPRVARIDLALLPHLPSARLLHRQDTWRP